jgi:propanol-preferring alcohol dehydrogenase
MRALRLIDWKSEPELVEVREPVAGPGDAVIRIGGAGACHSDLHLMHDFDAGVLPWSPPFTLGHENAGWVKSLGDGVEGFRVGQPVAVYGPWGCGLCERCRLGIETYCDEPVKAPAPTGGGGLGLDGGMAELMLVPNAERHLVALPEGLEPVLAAPLTDAGLTPYHAIRRSLAKLGPTCSVVVIGVGGLGHMAVQLLKATASAQVIAVDTRPDALKLALEAGADVTMTIDDEAAASVRDLTGGKGADVILDFVGADSTLMFGAKAARQCGDLTLVGLAGGSLALSFFSVPYELSVQSTYWGSRPELVEVLELAARDYIRPKVTTFPLDEAMDAYRALENAKLEGRAVITP